MRLVFEYAIHNNTGSPVGPFDLTSIFGAYKRESDVVFVEGDTFKFKATMENPLDITERKFSERVSALGLSPQDVFFVTVGMGQPHEDDLKAVEEVRKSYKPPTQAGLAPPPLPVESTAPSE